MRIMRINNKSNINPPAGGQNYIAKFKKEHIYLEFRA